MKIKLTILKLIAVLCSMFATTTAVFGATIVWNGGNGTGTAINQATNWVGGVLPNSANGDLCQWDSTVPGDLFLTAAGNNGNLNNGTPGVSFYIAAGHTGVFNLTSSNGASGNVALNSTTIDNGAGAVSYGDNSANVLNIIQRPSSSGNPVPIHTNLNNSAFAATIYPNVRYQSGGGNPHSIQFDGTGDWIVNNALNNANGGNNNDFIRKFGSGNMFWNANDIAGAAGVNGIGSPMDIEGGSMVLTASSSELNTQRITNNATFTFNAPAASQTLSGPFDGIGNIVVSGGTLTLSSSQSDWTGNIVLTNGGVLVAGGTQNVGGTGPLGTNSTIFFNGGTLQFSTANTYDYSPNFSTLANQAYSFNTAGQSVTFTNALTSSGATFTKLGSGTITLTGANTYTGNTTISGGKLVIQGSQGNGNIILANSTVLDVNQGGAQITPSTLTVGTSSGATLEFVNVTSGSTAAIAAGTLVAGGTIAVNINSGVFTLGTPYPLLSWTTGTFTVGNFLLGSVTGAGGGLSVSNNTLYFTPTALASKWTGNADAIWSATSGAIDWIAGGSPSAWVNGAPALFDDTVTSANTNIILGSSVIPNGVTVNNSTTPYSIASSAGNVISGSTALTKTGNGTLTLSGGGVNTYSGVTTIGGGTLSVGTLANGGSASDIGLAGNGAANLVINGGTLQLNATVGGATSDRLFTLGLANGAIDDESGSALTLNNTGVIVMSGSGARTLTLKGNGTDELDATLGDNGGATSLGKSGSGTWILGGNNTNSGTVTITSGTLQIGNGGANGLVGSGNIVDNGTIDFNTSRTSTNGAVTGTGAVTVDSGGTVILAGNNTYSGATTINFGTLQIGNGGASGSMNNANSIVDNDTFIDDSTSILTLNPAISGDGNVIVRKGTLQAIGNNTYTGWTEIDPGATFQPSLGNVGLLASYVVTNNGTLLLSRQDNNVFVFTGNIVGSGNVTKIANNSNTGDVTLSGVNTYTGGTYILGGAVIFGDDLNAGNGSFLGNVFLTNDTVHVVAGQDFVPAILTFNRPDNFIFPGNIVGQGNVTFTGYGTVTLTGTNNYVSGDTRAAITITAGTLQIGNGGTNGIIVGTNSIVDGSELVFDHSDTVTISGIISDGSAPGYVTQFGSGALVLNGANTYTGTTTVSNGTLVVNGANTGGSTYVTNGTFGGSGTFSGPVTLDAGTTLAPSALAATPTTLTINSDLSIGANLAFKVNKSLSPSNDLVVVSGALTNTGTGHLTITNIGPVALAVGDKFTFFNVPLTNGAALTVSGGGAGVTWANNLAVDGSVTVASVPVPSHPKITSLTFSGGNLIITATNNAGSGGGTFAVLSTNIITAPLTNWPAISTGTFDVNGNIALTNAVGTGTKFFILRAP
jgi:autotransporter-associated beta strand protein